MIPNDHPDKRPLNEAVAELEQRQREVAARWDPAVLMDQPELRDATAPSVVGQFADRLRVFWGSLAVTLAVWGNVRPSPPVTDDDVRSEIEQLAMAICYRLPRGTWYLALKGLRETYPRLAEAAPLAASAELPQAATAVKQALSLEIPPPPRGLIFEEDPSDGLTPGEALREGLRPRAWLFTSRVMATPQRNDDRLRLFWTAVWLALAAWEQSPDEWPAEPLRRQPRHAIEDAAVAVCSRRTSALADTGRQLRTVLTDARAARNRT